MTQALLDLVLVVVFGGGAALAVRAIKRRIARLELEAAEGDAAWAATIRRLRVAWDPPSVVAPCPVCAERGPHAAARASAEGRELN